MHTDFVMEQEIQEIDRRLESLSLEKPGLGEAAALYRQILPILRKAQARANPFLLDKRTALKKLEDGLPVLVGEELPFSQAADLNLLLDLCQAVESLPEAVPEAGSARAPGVLPGASQSRAQEVQKIRSACQQGWIQLTPIFQAALLRDTQPLRAAAEELGLDLPLFSFLVLSCLKPSLQAWAASLASRANEIDLSGWKRGKCPFCGDIPLLGELQGLQRSCHLRCGRCGADWPFNRLQCAFCETTDYQVLGFLRLGEKPERTLIQTCEACHSYLKTIVTFEPTHPGMLPVEDLATIPLDLIAIQHGYYRPLGLNSIESLSSDVRSA